MEKTKIQNSVPHKFENKKSDDVQTLVINGAIGESSWLYEATSANDVRDALLDSTAKEIYIKLNSGGGDVFQGIEIYNLLKDLKQTVTVEVTALAASAASIIAMGADHIKMRTGSNMMIHQASTAVYGNKKDLQRVLNSLETIDTSLISIYAQKTGMAENEIKSMIENETWLTADEALEKGFADSIEIVEEPKKEEPKSNANEEYIDAIVEKVLNKIENKTDKKDDVQNGVDEQKPQPKRHIFF